MAEQTTPATGVAGEALSVEQRLAAFYGGDKPSVPDEAKAPPPEAPEPPKQDAAPETAEQDESQADELSPDDIPDEGEQQEPPTPDAFEIVHNGTQHKLDRAKVIELAQKGFDYTEKTQQLSAERKRVQEMLGMAQQIEQMQPLLMKEQAVVSAFEQQLSQWQNVDWVRLATEEPLEYPRHRAQYDQLLHGYNAAQRAFSAKAQEVEARKAHISQQLLAQEMQKLRDFMPWIADPKKFEDVKATIADYGEKDGYTPQEIAAVAHAKHVRTLWKAAQYDRLVQSKAEKVKQMRAAPPTAKPGAVGQTPSAEAKRITDTRARLKKTGDWRDAAALIAKMK